MYFPFFRGKQYELIAIREFAGEMSPHVCPIIEPVKIELAPLKRTVATLVESSVPFILIANPSKGELSDSYESLFEDVLDSDPLNGYEGHSIGILLHDKTNIDEVGNLLQKTEGRKVSLIHQGFRESQELVSLIEARNVQVKENIFIEGFEGKLYRRKFKQGMRVLVRNGFKKRDSNREYPLREYFSDLHLTYGEEEGMGGFGDYLIAGDDFQSSGGPAWTIAIHLTYLDQKEDLMMMIKHYLSDRTDSMQDPGGKFLEALGKLIADDDPNIDRDTSAFQEFEDLHKRKHYPGLGYLKKISMLHHMETLVDYLDHAGN